MTVVLIFIVLLLFVDIVRLRRKQRNFELQCQIAALRRELISLIHQGSIDISSSLFRFTYKLVELLLRIHYFRLHFLLPDPWNEATMQDISEEQKQQIMELQAQVKELRT